MMPDIRGRSGSHRWTKHEVAGAKAKPDWRNPDDYRHLLDLDRAGWAWEWLRRHRDYVGEVDQGNAISSETNALAGTIRPIQLAAAAHDRAPAWGLCFRGGGRLSRRAGAAYLGRAA
ncbi:transcriptional regulator domain-containing protein [Acidiphilium iwatense]|uniref:transcriptional regulator domain-containing protein n=1 Tax=Acidiphilium iwatense TaxID=768198 RepID=UPI0038B3D554